MEQGHKAILALEDGAVFEGWSFGCLGEKTGEVVFNTSMTGYQEILTDPSYKGQIVTMTYPLIGNYGINQEDIESQEPKVEGFIIKENSPIFSNWRGDKSLSDYLIRHRIMGVEGMDTRAITKHIRLAGAMKAVLSTEDLNRDRLIEKAKISPGLIGRDLVKEVTCEKPFPWTSGNDSQFSSHLLQPSTHCFRPKVVVMDFGIKYNILRSLYDANCEVTVLPASSRVESILSYHPHGILLSNGPGDPEGVTYAIETVHQLIGKKPIFGICLGHQLLGLALGGRTFKLKFGHRGANQPVKDLKSGRVMITSQNHGFCVDPHSLDPSEVELTQINLNDQTLEGMRHKRLPIFSVQYHPEASPGPHDTQNLFGEFIKMMELNSPLTPSLSPERRGEG
ncbi:MAG: carbamoyl phosphate synthase small subunit [Deltaproteobacteria bacterium RBG_19FT_COMBO_46_12]|nr:MAG: carbamoyl phosphate synthase small subunit [Deltaproteobacteria bacterium RBG_19FT_COMBO_46_12]